MTDAMVSLAGLLRIEPLQNHCKHTKHVVSTQISTHHHHISISIHVQRTHPRLTCSGKAHISHQWLRTTHSVGEHYQDI